MAHALTTQLAHPGIVARISHGVAVVIEAVAKRLAYRRTRRALEMLSTAELDDLGVIRENIGQAAHRAVYDPTWR